MFILELFESFEPLKKKKKGLKALDSIVPSSAANLHLRATTTYFDILFLPSLQTLHKSNHGYQIPPPFVSSSFSFTSIWVTGLTYFSISLLNFFQPSSFNLDIKQILLSNCQHCCCWVCWTKIWLRTWQVMLLEVELRALI